MPLWFTILFTVTGSCLFCWYIAPERRKSPSKMQRLVAKIWIIFRRLISFSGACLGALVIYIIWVSTESIGYKLLNSIVVASMSFYFLYVGIVGQGWVQHSFRDDISLYKRIKEKYGFRW